MGKGLNRLSGRTVATKTARGYYADGGGLYLQVSKVGTKSWIFRYARDGRTRDMGLGSVDIVGLIEARAAASECRKQLHQGKDPIASRQAVLAAEAGVPLFKEAARTFVDDHKAAWKNEKHVAQWLASLETYSFPVIGEKRVDAVMTQDALEILRPIWSTKTETANRVRQRCESILDAETVKGHRRGENPFRWRGGLQTLLPAPLSVRKARHHPALPYQELPGFMRQLRKQTFTSAKALEFIILTVARVNMACGALWDEFDEDFELWRVPGARMKGGLEHLVPLAAYVRRLLQDLQRDLDSVYVFPGQRRGHLSIAAPLQYLQHLGYGHVTVHGFRSTFKDWAAETTPYANEVSEAALAHTIKDKAEAAYRRGQLLEKRRGLMEDWARYCLGDG